jgi:hypothetical protein
MHVTQKNKGAYRPPPSKGQQNPIKGILPGKRSAIIQHAWSPKNIMTAPADPRSAGTTSSKDVAGPNAP